MKKLLCLLCFVFVGFMYSHVAQAQTATINPSNFQITLDASAPLQPSYTASITALGFTSELRAKRFFDAIRSNTFVFTVNFAAGTVTIDPLEAHLATALTVAEWNTILTTKQENFFRKYNTMPR
ncbi:MAG: hypothetical protein EAZ57_09030 [Cytophagales bacterium]|nr:MAG: hypothetical protein EAZ67_09840 [Cytophagales bacterium]TAF60040.1 MAG: hypothetical protein EAZ57_09030 [Cytophagales bacterium]